MSGQCSGRENSLLGRGSVRARSSSWAGVVLWERVLVRRFGSPDEIGSLWSKVAGLGEDGAREDESGKKRRGMKMGIDVMDGRI